MPPPRPSRSGSSAATISGPSPASSRSNSAPCPIAHATTRARRRRDRPPTWYAASGGPRPRRATSAVRRPRRAARPGRRRGRSPPAPLGRARARLRLGVSGRPRTARPHGRSPRRRTQARAARLASRWLRPSTTSASRIASRIVRPGRSSKLRPLRDDDGPVRSRSASSRWPRTPPCTMPLASATGSQATTSAPSASRRDASTMLGASRMSSVFGLNASPSSAIRLPRSGRGASGASHRTPHLELVDLDHADRSWKL